MTRPRPPVTAAALLNRLTSMNAERAAQMRIFHEVFDRASSAPLRAVRTEIPADRAGTEPAGAVTPGQAAPAPAGSDHPHRFLKLARAE